VEPHYLTLNSMKNMFKVVEKHRDRIRKDTIFSGVKW